MPTPFFETPHANELIRKFKAAPNNIDGFIEQAEEQLINQFQEKLTAAKDQVAATATSILKKPFKRKDKFATLLEDLTDDFVWNEFSFYKRALRDLASSYEDPDNVKVVTQFERSILELKKWKLNVALERIKQKSAPRLADIPVDEESEEEGESEEPKGPGIIRRSIKALGAGLAAGGLAVAARSKTGRALIKTAAVVAAISTAWGSGLAQDHNPKSYGSNRSHTQSRQINNNPTTSRSSSINVENNTIRPEDRSSDDAQSINNSRNESINSAASEDVLSEIEQQTTILENIEQNTKDSIEAITNLSLPTINESTTNNTNRETQFDRQFNREVFRTSETNESIEGGKDYTPREETIEKQKNDEENLDENEKQTKLLEQIEINTRGEGEPGLSGTKSKSWLSNLISGIKDNPLTTAVMAGGGLALGAKAAGLIGAGAAAVASALPFIATAAIAGYSVNEALNAVKDVLNGGTGENGISRIVDSIGKSITGNGEWNLGKAIHSSVSEISTVIDNFMNSFKTEIEGWKNAVSNAVNTTIDAAKNYATDLFTTKEDPAIEQINKRVSEQEFNTKISTNVKEDNKYTQYQQLLQMKKGLEDTKQWDPEFDPGHQALSHLITQAKPVFEPSYEPKLVPWAENLEKKVNGKWEPGNKEHQRAQAILAGSRGPEAEKLKNEIQLKKEQEEQRKLETEAVAAQNAKDALIKSGQKWDPVNVPHHKLLEEKIKTFESKGFLMRGTTETNKITSVDANKTETNKITSVDANKTETNKITSVDANKTETQEEKINRQVDLMFKSSLQQRMIEGNPKPTAAKLQPPPPKTSANNTNSEAKTVVNAPTNISTMNKTQIVMKPRMDDFTFNRFIGDSLLLRNSMV